MKKIKKRKQQKTVKDKISREQLTKYYTDKELTIKEVAKIFGCSESYIYNLLVKYSLVRSQLVKVSKEDINDLYWNKDWLVEAIANKFNCSASCILRKMKKYGIKTKEVRKLKISKEELYRLYVIEGKTTCEIGELFGFSCVTVGKLLKKYKIKLRKAEDNFKHMKFVGENHANYINIPDKELIDLRCNKNMTTYEIAKIYNCHNSTISEKLKALGIPVVNLRYTGKPKCIDCGKEITYCADRCKKCNLKFYVGNKSHFYIDGRTPLTSLIRNLSEYRTWRNSVYKKDNYTCQECGKHGGKLEAHHCNKPFSVIFSEFLELYNNFSPIEDKETLVRLATKYGEFWNIGNGKTLCVDCHELYLKDTFSKIKNVRENNQ